MTDAAASYLAAIRALRLLGVLTAQWWPVEEDEFDLIIAAALMRGRSSATD